MFRKISLLFMVSLLFVCISCAKDKNALNRKIVCFGDSLTEGFGASNGKNYPYFLEEMSGMPVVNLGIRGNTSMQGLYRIEDVTAQKPFIVLIEFGANDFFWQVPIEQTKKAIEKIVDTVQSSGAIAVIVSTHDGQLPDLSAALKNLAEEKNVPFISGILNEIWTKRELFADQLHPNSNGYKFVAEKIYKNILPIINK